VKFVSFSLINECNLFHEKSITFYLADKYQSYCTINNILLCVESGPLYQFVGTKPSGFIMFDHIFVGQ